MNMRFIYKLIAPNNKIYIGQTNNIKRRIEQYKYLWCKKQPKLYNSLIKYGWENFILEIIEYVADEFADEYERFYIKKYNSVNAGLNHDSGGHYGKTHSKETRKKMSDSGKKKIFTEQHKNNLKKAKKEFWQNKEKLQQRQQCINALITSIKTKTPVMSGKHHSEKTKLKLKHAASLQTRDKTGKFIK